MLDTADPIAHGQLDGFWGIGMGGHIGFSISGFRHCRLDFLRRVLRAIEGIHRRGHATGDVDLQEVRAGPKYVARGLSHRIRAIGHNAKGAMAHLTGAIGHGKGPALHIAMAARLGNHEVRLNNTRTPDHAAANGPLKPDNVSPEITNRGEAPAHRLFRKLRHGNAKLHLSPLRETGKVQSCQPKVYVRVDETGHKELPVGINHRLCIGAVGTV